MQLSPPPTIGEKLRCQEVRVEREEEGVLDSRAKESRCIKVRGF
jgi:hypothetical protein